MFTLLVFAALPVHAETPDQICLTSEKVLKIFERAKQPQEKDSSACAELLKILIVYDESNAADAGCVTKQMLAQICKNTWGDDTEPCEQFVYKVSSGPETPSFKPLTFTNKLDKTDFTDIDPVVFRKAVERRIIERGRYKGSRTVLKSNIGDAYLKYAKEYKVDPFLLVGISMYESSYGTSDEAQTKNNIAGLKNGNGYKTFPTVEASVEDEARTVRRWMTQGMTLLGLGRSGHYCNASVADRWSDHISSTTKRFYNFYNEALENKQ